MAGKFKSTWCPLLIIMALVILATSSLAVSNSSFSRVWENDSDWRMIPVKKSNDNLQSNSTSSSRTDYAGRLIVYVVEPISRWLDNGESVPAAAPKPFGNAVIAYAFDEDIYVSETMDVTFDWDADAAGFGDITESNLKVIGVLFNAEIHQGYSDPGNPSFLPYDAHYVDAAVDAFSGETNNNSTGGPYTHTVFLEESAATW